MDLGQEIAALSILCQGFLFVHTNKQGDPAFEPAASDYSVIRKALDRMGADKALQQCEVLAPDFRQRAIETEDIAWWADCFQGLSVDLRLKVDSDIGVATTELLNRIVHRGPSPLSTHLVARAYIEICDYFSGPRVVLPQPTVAIVSEWDQVIAQILRNPHHLYELHWKKFGKRLINPTLRAAY